MLERLLWYGLNSSRERKLHVNFNICSQIIIYFIYIMIIIIIEINRFSVYNQCRCKLR